MAILNDINISYNIQSNHLRILDNVSVTIDYGNVIYKHKNKTTLQKSDFIKNIKVIHLFSELFFRICIFLGTGYISSALSHLRDDILFKNSSLLMAL